MPAKALFINSDRIGDCVLFSGVLEGLRQRWPDVEITLACGPVAAPLFRAAPNVVDIIPIPKRRWAGHWIDLWQKVWPVKWDCVVDIRGSGIAYLLRTRERRIYQRNLDQQGHKVDVVARLMGSSVPLEPEITLDTSARAVAASAMQAVQGPVLALAPISNFANRSWAPERWAALVDRLAHQPEFDGWQFMLVGGPGDQPAAAPALAAAGARSVDFVAKGDILAAAAALSRSTLFVGNDSGLMHVSAAVGTPTLGLFGPSEWWLKAPRGPKGRYIAAAPVRGQFASIENLDVDRVFSAVMELKAAFAPV